MLLKTWLLGSPGLGPLALELLTPDRHQASVLFFTFSLQKGVEDIYFSPAKVALDSQRDGIQSYEGDIETKEGRPTVRVSGTIPQAERKDKRRNQAETRIQLSAS